MEHHWFAGMHLLLMLLVVSIQEITTLTTNSSQLKQWQSKSEDDMKENTRKLQQLEEIWKLKLEMAEIRIKLAEAEAARTCTLECDERIANSTSNLQHMVGLVVDGYKTVLDEVRSQLLTCRDESTTIENERSSCHANFSEALQENSLLRGKFEACFTKLELPSTSEKLPSTTKKLPTTKEELISTLQELPSTTEELPSSSEELSTTTEELPSTTEVLPVEEETEDKSEEETETIYMEQLKKLVNKIRNGRIHHIGGKVYVTQFVNKAWQPALETCQYLNMSIVSLQTREKWNLITEYLNDISLVHWFWASGRQSFGKWTWSSTNETMTFSDWKRGPYDEPCMYFLPNYGWDDYRCSGWGNDPYVMCE